MPEKVKPGPKRTGRVHYDSDGYAMTYAPEHPLTRPGQNCVALHRVVLYDKIGPGSHPCHWCGGTVTWGASADDMLTVDHVDHKKLNNDPDNLVPAHNRCNANRDRERDEITGQMLPRAS